MPGKERRWARAAQMSGTRRSDCVPSAILVPARLQGLLLSLCLCVRAGLHMQLVRLDMQASVGQVVLLPHASLLQRCRSACTDCPCCACMVFDEVPQFHHSDRRHRDTHAARLCQVLCIMAREVVQE